MSHRVRIMVLLLVAVAFVAAGLALRNRDAVVLPIPDVANPVPKQVSDGGYVSSSECRSCHQEQYDSWHATYHRTMTQVASPETVLAPFDNTRLQSRGREYLAYRRGDEFRVRMPDPAWEARMIHEGVDIDRIYDPPMADKKVVMTTGSHHFQGYWVSSPTEGVLRKFPWFYHIAEQRWIPREDAFLEPPEGGRHFKVWNTACIACHSVRGRPGYNPVTGMLSSKVAELGIACEACHGPAGEHVELHRNKPADNSTRLASEPSDTIVNPERLSPIAASQVCGQCHSGFYPRDIDDWLSHGHAYRPGEDIEDSRILMRFGEPFFQDEPSIDKGYYWPDGTMRVGGREFLGMIESACHLRGELSCLSCHSMHHSDPNDQLAAGMDGNQACLQCHTTMAERLEEHTHHPRDSVGSLCYNCHMPFQSFALLKAIRSHRIDSPSVATSVRTGRPQACNQCHVDKPLGWTAEHLHQWYGTPIPDLSEDEQTVAANVLWLLRGDPVQRVIATWCLGWPSAQTAAGEEWQIPFLIQMLDDPYSAIRYVAFLALRSRPGFDDLTYDFVAPPEERARKIKAAWELWQQTQDPQTLRNRRSVLFSADGELLMDELNRFLQNRDNSPVAFPE